MAWTAETILETIRKQNAAGANLSYNAMQKRMQSLLSAAAYHFGSYRAAVTKAGIDYAAVTRRPRWTKELIVQQIKKAAKKNQDLSWAVVTRRKDELARAAFSSLQPRLFGSWQKALQAAGVDPSGVSRYQMWDKHRIAKTLKDLHRKKEPVSSGALQVRHPGLYAAAVRYFQTFDAALKSAGLNPQAVRQRIAWSRPEVIKRMKSVSHGTPVSTATLRNNHTALYGAAMRLFGSIKAARKAAGVK